MSSTPNAQNNTSSSHNNTTDPWSFSSDTKVHGAHHTRATKPKATKHVPDAWDDDEDDAGADEKGVDNATLWNAANAKLPMPEVILTTSSTSTSAAPPPEALQQPMRILKRPSAATSSSSSSVNSTGSGTTTLKDREAAYQAARARIFGDGERKDGDVQEVQDRLKNVNLGLGSASPKLGRSSSPLSSGDDGQVTATSILRNPLGPPSSLSFSTTDGPSSPGVDRKGFVKRRGGSVGSGGKVSAVVGGGDPVSSAAASSNAKAKP